jgi:glycosyltransferase involved in cell wall biosynthesis
MKKALTISIIIPAYNEEALIEACLNSIAAQSVKPDEVIVVDNNSTDKTAKIAAKYSFVTLLNETVQGVAYARNTGFNAAKSVLIGRIDADTHLPKTWVADVLKFYEMAGTKVALSGGCYFYNMRLPRFYGWALGQIAFRFNLLLLEHYIMFGSNMVLPASIWDEIKNEVCMRKDIHEDLDLSIHIHRHGYRIAYKDTLKVGVKMKRVRTQRDELWKNLMLWPQTLRTHGRWTWIFGWLGAVMLYSISPVGNAMEFIARIFGRKPIKD